jgi:hypothetical protein
MLTLKQINKELSIRHPGYELVRGKGYFYIEGPGTESWYSTMIYVYRVNHLPLHYWIESIDILFAQNNRL